MVQRNTIRCSRSKHEKIKFLQIAEIIEDCMNVFKENYYDEITLDSVIELDKKVREYIRMKWEMGVN